MTERGADMNDLQGRFFDAHQWRTMDAATARIIPTDHDAGAKEAGVVHFIDRYLCGIDYVYANPYGSGFLRLEGEREQAWTLRMEMLQERYRVGLTYLDELSRTAYGQDFADSTDEQQDEVLARISGASKPERFLPTSVSPDRAVTDGLAHGNFGISLERPEPVQGKAIVLSQPVTDDTLDFFETLVLHTRQGFYADPAYGGNRNHIGWDVIGYPGPKSIAETRDGRYSTMEYLEEGNYEVVAPELVAAEGRPFGWVD
jgi:gluconate 2-dehydrogenase gamma chain